MCEGPAGHVGPLLSPTLVCRCSAVAALSWSCSCATCSCSCWLAAARAPSGDSCRNCSCCSAAALPRACAVQESRTRVRCGGRQAWVWGQLCLAVCGGLHGPTVSIHMQASKQRRTGNSSPSGPWPLHASLHGCCNRLPAARWECHPPTSMASSRAASASSPAAARACSASSTVLSSAR